MSTRSVSLASVALGLTLAVLVGALIVIQVRAADRARDRVAHTHAVIEQNLQLLSLVQDAESGERGYLLTGDPAYLAPYVKAAPEIPKAGARLAALVAENPGQSEHVRELNIAAAERMAVIDHVVERARSDDHAGALELVRQGQGYAAMSRLRARAAMISSSENILLEQRRRRAEREENVNLAIALTLGAIALAGLVGSAISQARINRQLTQSQAARAAGEALQAAIFENVPDYLFVVRIEEGDRFVVGDVNPAFERALNVSAERIRGQDLRGLLPARVADMLIAHYRRVRAADAPVLTRDVIPGLPDGPRTWESILAPVKNAAGVADRIIGTARDITERVRSEERLRAAQRMEAVGQLTGGVAHDFNNLLQVIRGNLELLEPVLEGQAQAQRRLKSALHGTERAAQLTRQLLAFARRQPLEPEVINLSRLVGEMADLLRRTLGESIEVETVVAGGLWNTLADPAQVESAILNLALNARDAMPDGGRLTIEITNASLDEAYGRGAEDLTPGQYVLLAISDTGQGMDAATLARAFEPFFTTKSGDHGTGLGLAMVYGFVRQSKGHVQIYSEPDHGTTVKIYLPRSRQPESVGALPAEVRRADTGERTILVVEDETAVRAAAVGMLEGLGYQCLEAGNAADALEIMKNGAKVDLVFTDVVMPGPLSTRDFAQNVREMSPELPILFTSGYTENAIIHHGRLDDGVSLLAKPYARDDLARKVAQLIA
ncbi:MAG TPA: CHASE3 domain-containing protein [Caulobacteraceae bacterium]|nr:CHASE3 domain-containing protein [Caulobacteraceae bacterium]